VAEPKTRKTTASVEAYLKKAAKGDAYEACKFIGAVMAKVTKDKPAMWGPAIVGYGSSPITYANGSVLDWPEAAYSARSTAVVIYGTKASPKHAALMKKIGKAKMGGGCLYLKSLEGVDKKVLEELIVSSIRASQAKQKAKKK
jgi:hypothetical protein